MGKKAVIFDIDGTIWDSTKGVVESWNEVFRRHSDVGIQMTLPQLQSYMGKNLSEIATLLLPHLDSVHALDILDEAIESELDYLRVHPGDLYNGIEQVFAELSEKYDLYIVSNCENGYIELLLDVYELHEYFTDSECTGRTGKSKAENIKLILERNHVEQAVYVGDTVIDRDASANADIPFIYASYGFGDVKDAEYAVQDPKEITALVQNILEYVRLKDLATKFGLKKGDKVMISSDLKQLMYECVTRGDDTDLNVFLDGIIDIIGEEGTIFIPTFNWDFCKGKTFDYYKTPCKTGSLGKIALKRNDFRRTKHPIYSFAVWGKDQKELCDIDYKSSFGIESPFTYCRDHNAKNIFIDVECQHSFTFVHYVEEQVGISYRYLKDFTAEYIDENGQSSTRTYSMNVRDLDKDIFITIYPFEEEFKKAGASRRFLVNGISMKVIDMGTVYPIIADDVKNNRSRKICTYTGQEDE